MFTCQSRYGNTEELPMDSPSWRPTLVVSVRSSSSSRMASMGTRSSPAQEVAPVAQVAQEVAPVVQVAPVGGSSGLGVDAVSVNSLHVSQPVPGLLSRSGRAGSAANRNTSGS